MQGISILKVWNLIVFAHISLSKLRGIRSLLNSHGSILSVKIIFLSAFIRVKVLFWFSPFSSYDYRDQNLTLSRYFRGLSDANWSARSG